MDITIDNVDSLNAELFANLLRGDHGRSGSHHIPFIESVTVERVDEGVLSLVYRVHLTFTNTAGDDYDDPTQLVSNWMVKLVRKDLNLRWMCKNETTFYSCYAPALFDVGNSNEESVGSTITSALPFAIPKFLNGSDQHLILQEILDVQTFPLAEGCPPDKIDFLLNSLAALHAQCWEASCFFTKDKTIKDDLVFPTGMGQRLSPLQKEGLFVTSWQETVEHTFAGTSSNDSETYSLREFAIDFCQRLANLRLRDVHDMVHRHRVTCVHGDYHVANWLFPRDSDDGSDAGKSTNSRPVLVDWATAGYGNPMIDLVFFLVVSTNDQVAAEAFQVWLPKYSTVLLERIRHHNVSPQKATLEELKEWFQWALLCQWLILVAYDNVCRKIAMSELDEGRRESQLRHFRNVNRRAILALKSVHGWGAILSKLSTTTTADRFEAQQFCETKPLEI